MSVRMRRRPRLSYANVMSTFAVFAALGGTAFAAAPLITGKEIKDSSITSADVKNRSLTELDFAASSLAKLRGATG
ncbi:MAG: hypothetical protein JWN72_1321, partial [Thermoleophilia bacterium]|nr:hypothetical protein [Thermoleophilia bacterium]